MGLSKNKILILNINKLMKNDWKVLKMSLSIFSWFAFIVNLFKWLKTS